MSIRVEVRLTFPRGQLPFHLHVAIAALAPGGSEQCEQIAPGRVLEQSYERSLLGAARDQTDHVLVIADMLEHYDLTEEILGFLFGRVFCGKKFSFELPGLLRIRLRLQ